MNSIEFTVYRILSIDKSYKCVRDFKYAEMDNEHINEHDQLIFPNWKLEYGKSYDNDFTAIHRMQIFMRNKKNIEVLKGLFINNNIIMLESNQDQDSDELALKMFRHLDFNDDDVKFSNHHFFSKQDIKELRNHPILTQRLDRQRQEIHQIGANKLIKYGSHIETIRKFWKLLGILFI